MQIWKLLVGIMLVIGTVGAMLLSLQRTQPKRRRQYGPMYGFIGINGVIGGVLLSFTSFA